MVQAHHHRPTLKQSNKPFKSKHSTKSSLKDQAKGRTHKPTSGPANNAGKDGAAQLRANRRNAARQAQAQKRQATVAATRLFNGVDGMPRVVAVVPLCPDVAAVDIVKILSDVVDVEDGALEGCPNVGSWRLPVSRFKTSIQFINLPYRHLYATLDACKAADYVLFVLSDSVEVDKWGEMLLRTLQAQGLPQVIACVGPSHSQEPSDTKSDTKSARQEVVKSLLSFVKYFVPSQTRVFDLAGVSGASASSSASSLATDTLTALRVLCEGKPADVRWRENRPWVLADDLVFNPQLPANPSQDESAAISNTGTLLVTGYVRGAPLSPDRLVHIPGYGDFQVEKIMSAPLPRPSRSNSKGLKSGAMDTEPLSTLLAEPDPADADSLISTNNPDENIMQNEQTWPTEEEMQGDVRMVEDDDEDTQGKIPDARSGTTPKAIVKKRKVPKGTSAYQAAWIVDEDEEGEGDDDEDSGADVGSDNVMDRDAEDGLSDEDKEVVDEEEEQEEIDIPNRKTVQFEDMDMEEEARQLESWRSRTRTDAEQSDHQFPDELDTPRDIAARTRFQRYRGLRSFRTSPWDAFENLPRDYARIFQFEGFNFRKARAGKKVDEEHLGVEPSTRMTVYLKNVPRSCADELQSSALPAVIFGLSEYEHKVSSCNFTVQRNTEYDEPVRSKDPMIFCIGPRRFRTAPIYSQHTRGGSKGSNNVHKFERWLKHGVTSVATVYAPVVFGGLPLVMLRETEDVEAPHLVAMGSFMGADTTRIIAKRIILTGHPFKVHKKTATVRYMFFSSDDVAYFKPIQLYTKYGRTGHIKESLGTHGYFKAYFDGPINQMDTVCMALYKRVYPRWAVGWKSPIVVKGEDGAGGDDMEI